MANHFKKNSTSYIAGFLAFLIFIIIYGPYVLNPFYTDFLKVSGDLGQHYYGWELYRISDWFIKPGLMNKASYPYAVSVIFTDSIPLMALLSKWFCNGLNIRIQYFGIWESLCFVLQGYLGAKILSKYIDDKVCIILGSMFFVLSPCMMRRVFWHSALSAHFIILIAILLSESCTEIRTVKYGIYWGLLGGLCAMTHLYFGPMCAAILAGSCVYLLADFKEGIYKIILSVAGFFGCFFLAIYMLGGTVSGMDSGAPGIGYYSLNIKSFFCPDEEWSAFLKNIEYFEDGQYEGFVYLGLGLLILFFVAIIGVIVIAIKDGKIIKHSLHNTNKIDLNIENINEKPKYSLHNKFKIFKMLGILLTVIIILFVSTGGEISFGNKLWFRIDLGEKLTEYLSIVRASGRLAWPVVYYITIFTVVITDRIRNEITVGNEWVKKTLPYLVLGVGLIISVADLAPKLYDKHRDFAVIKEYTNPVNEECQLLDSLPINIEHIVFLDKDYLSQEQLYGFAEYAAENDVSINDFYFARNFTADTKKLALKNARNPKEDSVYILSEEGWRWTLGIDLNWYKAGGCYIGIKKW